MPQEREGSLGSEQYVEELKILLTLFRTEVIGCGSITRASISTRSRNEEEEVKVTAPASRVMTSSLTGLPTA